MKSAKLPLLIFLSLLIKPLAANGEAEKSPPKYFLAICAVFQNESFFMREWLEFHKIVGVEHFYLYDNLSSDDSRALLEPYIESGEVELIEWPVETNNQKDYLELLQLPVYNHCLAHARDEARWIAFIDLDEFIFPVQHDDLPQLLEQYSSCGGLAANWQIFGTSWVESLAPGELLTEHLRLKAPINYPTNKFVKLIAQPRHVREITSPHNFNFHRGYLAVDSAFHKLMPTLITQKVNIEKIRVNHYWSGTEEWFWREKIPRRTKWGHHYDEERILNLLSTYNKVYDDSICRFLPLLKANMSGRGQLPSDDKK